MSSARRAMINGVLVTSFANWITDIACYAAKATTNHSLPGRAVPPAPAQMEVLASLKPPAGPVSMITCHRSGVAVPGA